MTVRGGKPRSSARSSYNRIVSNLVMTIPVTTYLRSTQHYLVQQDPQLFESIFTGTTHAIFLDGREDFIVPKARLRVCSEINNVPNRFK